MMVYLLKVSVVTGIFYLCYRVFLQRETFFEKNRLFLLSGLILAFLIPFIVIPNYVEAPALEILSGGFETITDSVGSEAESYSLIDITFLLYSLGFLVFFVRFFLQLTSLGRLIISEEKKQVGSFYFVETKKNIAPFSFFNRIVYNREQFSRTELEQIISHEKVHAAQQHSVDILIGQISCIVLWFNPFIWLYNKALKQNLEFIADHTAIQESTCQKSYQYALLKTSLPKYQFALGNPFYNSLIKKRIIMLQQSKSKKINQFKYVLVIPALALFLMSFNTKTIYIEKEVSEGLKTITPITPDKQEPQQPSKAESKPVEKTKLKEAVSKPKAKAQERVNYVINKNTSNSELDAFAADAKMKGVSLKFKGLKRNSEGSIIAIKIEAKSEDSNANYNTSSDTPINVIKISFDGNGKGISIGNAAMKYKISKVKTAKGGAYTVSTADSDAYTISATDDSNQIVVRNVKEEKEKDQKVKIKKLVGKQKNKNTNDNDNEAETIVIVEDDAPESIVVKATDENETDRVSVETASGKEPLYVLDGKVVEKEAIRDLSPKDIEKINVLKGDSATKKYGKKAQDGVIEITTKK